ncbi:unnamed protein product [Moneuplotes crassus]|uniref:Uncharacterized protein n=1 Tax=Euplotes crassus TaxID=5936 RepID=A0AAD1X6W6_EUPCR|nr:unnamed protein product [Moneuplotes crassus]
MKAQVDKHSLTAALSVLEQLLLKVDEQVTEIEIRRMQKPFAVEFIFDHLEKFSWWLFQTPDEVPPSCAYHKVDNRCLQYDEFDEPVKCGLDTISHKMNIRKIYKEQEDSEKEYHLKKSSVRLKKLSSKKSSVNSQRVENPKKKLAVKKPREPKKKLRIKQFPVEDPVEVYTDAQKQENKIIKANRKLYFRKEQQKQKEYTEMLERMEIERQYQEERKAMLKKILKHPITFDHRGEPMKIKKTGDSPFDLDENSAPPHFNFKDQGISEATQVFKLEKRKYNNDRNYLEEFLTMEDAKKYMDFSEQDFQKKWFSKYPNLIESKTKEINLDEYFQISEGVKYRKDVGARFRKGPAPHTPNQMTRKEYCKIVGGKNLADRHKVNNELMNTKSSDFMFPGKNIGSDYEASGQRKFLASSQKSVRSHSKRSVRSRNTNRPSLVNKISLGTEEAIKLLTNNKVQTNFRFNDNFVEDPKMIKTSSEKNNKLMMTPRPKYQGYMTGTLSRRHLSTANQGFRTKRSQRSTVVSTASTMGNRVKPFSGLSNKNHFASKFDGFDHKVGDLMGSPPRLLTSQSNKRACISRNTISRKKDRDKNHNFFETLRSN